MTMSRNEDLTYTVACECGADPNGEETTTR